MFLTLKCFSLSEIEKSESLVHVMAQTDSIVLVVFFPLKGDLNMTNLMTKQPILAQNNQF